MRPLGTLLLALLGSAPVLAQSPTPPAAAARHLLDFGAGISMNGSGDYNCLKTHLGYTRLLNRHFGVGPRVAMIGGSNNVYVGRGFSVPVSYQAVNLENEAYYAPFGNDRRYVLSLGTGFFVGYTRQTDFEYAGFYTDGTGTPVLQYQPRQTNGAHIGYLFSLNIDGTIDQRQRWLLGLKVALQNDTYANVLPGAQFRLARRL